MARPCSSDRGHRVSQEILRVAGGRFFRSESSTQRGIAATKSEARNPKFETNSNDQNVNDLNKFEKRKRNLLKKISRNYTLVVQRKEKI
jgi:hypothetical protein